MKTNNYFEPLFVDLPNDPNDFSYYEVRVWVKHQIIKQEAFNTLREARKYYKKRLNYGEEKGYCYVEIIHVKPLKK